MLHPRHAMMLFGGLSLAAMTLAGCGPKNEYVEPPPPPVKIAQPLSEAVTNYLEETGTTEAVDYVEIRARVKGFLKKIHFEPGDEVKAGDLLYEIEPEMYEAQLNQAIAAKAVAEAKRDNAVAQYNIDKPLFEKGAVSRAEFEVKTAAVAIAEAEIDASQASIDELRLNLSYTKIVSPIDGRIGKTLVYEGNLVGDGASTHLTTVVKYDPIYANFSINERDLFRLIDVAGEEDRRKKEDIQLFLRRDIDDEFTFAGGVNYADLTLDSNTATYAVRGVFQNPDLRIIPGAFVRIRVKGKTVENSLLVPESAVDMATSSLLVVEGDTVARRSVTTGLKLKNLVVIQEGISADDWVVVEGVQRARPGLKVTPEKTEMPPFEGDGVVIRESNVAPPSASGPTLDELEEGSGAEPPKPAENATEATEATGTNDAATESPAPKEPAEPSPAPDTAKPSEDSADEPPAAAEPPATAAETPSSEDSSSEPIVPPDTTGLTEPNRAAAPPAFRRGGAGAAQ